MPTPSTTLSPEAKKKIEAAYKKFDATLKKIVKEHRAVVKGLYVELDKKKAEGIKKKLAKVKK
ncbi:hypothetical protein EXS71_01215 [Candidatus Uhrbacteria bacterium]|nr:hypothetical protein [Candidatus Uhrbacteria bacterium]